MKRPLQLTIEDEIVDAAFRHIEGLFVLRQLINGKPWHEAMGIGGSSFYYWMSSPKGISYKVDGVYKQISVQTIHKRAMLWVECKTQAQQLSLF
jgi:hypothetical protein